jgi:D-serine deaminase-like pyridoxal phosphate-dependent protein
MKTAELQTPALIVSSAILDRNLKTMAEALPGGRCRPHVKAHKTTELAKRQAEVGHMTFCCATVKEMEGMAAAGLGEDLLLANEVLDTTRLGKLDARVTVAVDSDETVQAASSGGVREVLIDVNVGLPRCGVSPEDAPRLADLARSLGLSVRGVMGYEGHAIGLDDEEARRSLTEEAMDILTKVHGEVGGDLISAGGTGTFRINTWATEIQAGSYALMDVAYAKLGLPFELAVSVLATVISVSPGYAVADAGLKSLGMDHGNPEIDEGHQVMFVSDEHLSFMPSAPVKVGDRLRVLPAHVDPTVAYHSHMHVVDGEDVLESWGVDLRGW